MIAQFCVVTSVIFFVFFVYLLSSSNSVLTSPKPFTFSSNQTLVSPRNVFELGLFKPNESISRWYLGIWYKEDQKRTSLWVANRDRPLNTSVGTLKFFDNNLFLFDQYNVHVWWTNQPKGGVRSPMVAELLDNGNFVMKDSNDPERYLWQSFDFPTDTLLPQMKLIKIFDSLSSSDDPYKILYSWSSRGDPSSAYGYSFVIRNRLIVNTFAIFVDEYLIDTWNGYQFGDMPPVFELKEDWLVMKTLQSSSYSRLTMGQSGLYELYSWNSEAKEWNLSWSTGEDSCYANFIEKPCGSYSYCSKNNRSQLCNCMRGFYPKLEHEWNGCVRRNALHCRGDGFVKLQNMKLPVAIPFESTPNERNCKESCLLRCECTAFALVEVRKGERRCVTWTGELDHVRNYTLGGQDLYVRLAAKDLEEDTKNDGKSKGMDTWVIGLIVGAIITGLFVLGFFSFYYWKKHKGRTQETTQRDLIMNELVGPVDRFQFLEFRVVAEATNHFSDTNKLGQGGFGTVYKGTLPDGSDVAIKRLENTSSQGLREFKNEIQTILHVLHLNLVRLLGCCCEGEEIILIYEFIENASLNHYIFDEKQSQLLNWATRLDIIKGVAEGLLYLHRYTNPPIIHRDLKPSNILLDKDMIPKNSDFGMAKILESDTREAETEKAVGTRGYMSEEYAMDMKISERWDIFSFGVTVIEIITGERNLDYCNLHRGDSLLDKAWRYWNEGNGLQLVDSNYIDSSLVEEEVLRWIQVGLLCVQPHVDDRPSTKSVVLMFQSPQTEIPKPRIPNYFYARILRGETASSSSVGQSSTVNYATLSRLNVR
ncbi:PAN/Apple domain [Arabidopsis suecica]|uniref:Receptor-like serine/threonine-protein kinase n=1 Tax=Arabidopsis suecica TaxID=45249 RepID=A0A8T1ZI80_ARASU|nr:PAN/Apple domain [Arabidopsis suecica]